MCNLNVWKCVNLDVSHAYGSPRPVTRLILPSFWMIMLLTKFTFKKGFFFKYSKSYWSLGARAYSCNSAKPWPMDYIASAPVLFQITPYMTHWCKSWASRVQPKRLEKLANVCNVMLFPPKGCECIILHKLSESKNQNAVVCLIKWNRCWLERYNISNSNFLRNCWDC
jgi:hypothetical protein